MKPALGLALALAALALAGCGVDGPPVQPAAAPGVAVTGDAIVGLRHG